MPRPKTTLAFLRIIRYNKRSYVAVPIENLKSARFDVKQGAISLRWTV